MTDLSKDAQRLIFGFLSKPGSNLHFAMIESQPTTRTRSALYELCDAGLIEKAPAQQEAGELYTRTDKPLPAPTITARDIFQGDEWNLAEKVTPDTVAAWGKTDSAGCE